MAGREPAMCLGQSRFFDVACGRARQGLKAVCDAVHQPFELDIGNRLSAFCHCDGRAVHMLMRKLMQQFAKGNLKWHDRISTV